MFAFPIVLCFLMYLDLLKTDYLIFPLLLQLNLKHFFEINLNFSLFLIMLPLFPFHDLKLHLQHHFAPFILLNSLEIIIIIILDGSYAHFGHNNNR